MTVDEDEAEEIREAIREAMRSYGKRTPRKKTPTDDQKPGDGGTGGADVLPSIHRVSEIKDRPGGSRHSRSKKDRMQ